MAKAAIRSCSEGYRCHNNSILRVHGSRICLTSLLNIFGDF